MSASSKSVAYRHLLVAYEGTSEGDQAVVAADLLAQRDQARLTIVVVVELERRLLLVTRLPRGTSAWNDVLLDEARAPTSSGRRAWWRHRRNSRCSSVPLAAHFLRAQRNSTVTRSCSHRGREAGSGGCCHATRRRPYGGVRLARFYNLADAGLVSRDGAKCRLAVTPDRMTETERHLPRKHSGTPFA